MNAMDRQTSAVRNMRSPGPVAHFTRVADVMHALLVNRADQLVGFVEGSAEEAEFGQIAGALVAYEELRWPCGKVPGGKG
jgi:hypothetical protein